MQSHTHSGNSRPPSASSTKKAIMEMLQETAQLRAGKLDSQSLALYSSRLSREPFEDVKSALEKLAEHERKEYEPAMPEIGIVLALVAVETTARHNRSNTVKSERLVRWQCPNCRSTLCGFPHIAADLFRKCQKEIKGAEGQKMPCGGMMDVIFDQSNQKSGEMMRWSMR